MLDPIRRVTGVGEADLFGTQYAMRIWLNPNQLESYNLDANDVIAAIQAQNAQVPVGQLGARPSVKGQEINLTLQGQSTLTTVKQFENILLRVNPDGSRVYLRDVARVEMGGETYALQARVDGRPTAAVGIRLAPSANAVATANAVRAKVAELSKFFPAGVRVDFPYDSSEFVRASIKEVVTTLVEAIVMVFLIIFLFLQNFRATFIPTIVIPVALLGTFAVMYALGFSINVLTMFGMVLAVGELVDDAIVVVENVERIMSEEGLPPREATIKAMKQITGALIGISLVLTAVFIPMAFFGGSVGAIYRQFSLSLISCMLFSIFLAMSLTPALCASLLKPVEKGHHLRKEGFFGWFNRGFLATRKNYEGFLARTHQQNAAVSGDLSGDCRGGGLALLPSALVLSAGRRPGLFHHPHPIAGGRDPATHGGRAQAGGELLFEPAGSGGHGGRGRLQLQRPGAKRRARLRPFERLEPAPRRATRRGRDHRPRLHGLGPDQGRHHLSASTRRRFPNWAFPRASTLNWRTRAASATTNSCRRATSWWRWPRPIRTSAQICDAFLGLEDTPQLKVDIDQAKASALGVSLADLNTVLTTYFGSDYINNFVNGNRVQRVIAQLDAPYRMLPQDVSKVFVRNSSGQMVSLASLATLALDLRLAVVAALQRLSVAGIPGVRAAGQEHRPGHDRHGKAGREIAHRLWLRMDRPVLRGTPVGQTGAPALRAVAHRGVPGAGRAL